MLAYHNDPALKKATLAKIAAHREADRIIQGTYWAKTKGAFRGCAVGCLLERSRSGHERYHERYETEFGIPAQLAWLEDRIFESLPGEQSQLWPERFMDAIQVGADLNAVWPRFATWLMVDPEWGVINTTDMKNIQIVCRRVAGGYMRAADGNPLSTEVADALAQDARAMESACVAWDAQSTWTDTLDAWSTRAAWDGRPGRPARAAASAWDARSMRASDMYAFDEFVSASADKLIELLSSAPVPRALPSRAACAIRAASAENRRGEQ